MEFAGLYSVSDAEDPINEALRRGFKEAARIADIEAMLKLYTLQENFGLSVMSLRDLQTEVTSIVLKDYEAAVDRKDVAGMLKAYAFGQSGLTDPAKIPPLGKDPNLDRIFLEDYRAAVDRRDAEGIVRALAFSQSGFVSPEAMLKTPDVKFTEIVRRWYDSARAGRDAAGLLRAYGYVERSLVEPFIGAEELARDLAAIAGATGAANELDNAAARPDDALEKARERVEAAKSDGEAAVRTVEEMIRNAEENTPSGVAGAMREVIERERTFDEDLAFHDRIMNQVNPLMERLPDAIAAHGAAAYSRYWENVGGYVESMKIHAEQARAQAEEEARRTLANYTRIVARIEAPAAIARLVRTASTQAKAALSAVQPAANPFRSTAAGGLRISDIHPPPWKATSDYSAVRRALASGASSASSISGVPDTSGGAGAVDRTGAPQMSEVKTILERLFSAYEAENPSAFEQVLALGFAGSDRTGHNYDGARFSSAMRDDFRNLDRIEFGVNVTRLQYYSAEDRVKADLAWRRRAYLQSSSFEWLIDDQRTTLIFARENALREMKLTGIEGDPIFGIAEPLGPLVISAGTLNGVKVTTPIAVNQGETTSGNPTTASPTASAMASPASGAPPLIVTLTGSASDPDGFIASYAWNFGDNTSGTGQTVTHTYALIGSYIGTLTATDNTGATAQASVTITVSNASPTVSIAPSATSGVESMTVNFSTTASDPDGSIVSYAWTFGDGASSTSQNPSHTYTIVGTYTARVTVADNLGATATADVTIMIAANQAPIVSANANPTSGVNPLTVNFSANASDPDGTIQSYFWNFGDGQTSTSPNPSNIYASAGTYTASVTVHDNLGAGAGDTRTISVTSSDLHQSGTISSDTTWSGNVFIDNDITVNPGVTVTVSAGATVTVTGNYKITVNGSLDATSATFLAQSGTAGSWGGIEYAIGRTGTFSSNDLRDAATGVRLFGGPTSFNGNTFTRCSDFAILGGTAGVSQSFTNNTFNVESNGRGIYLGGGGTGIVISNNVFTASTVFFGYGIEVIDGAGIPGGTVSGNTFTGLRSGSYMHGFLSPWTVTGNLYNSCGNPGGNAALEFNGTGTHFVTNNIIGSGSGGGIRMQSGSPVNWTISGNSVTGRTGFSATDGIFVCANAGQTIILTGNNVTNCSGYGVEGCTPFGSDVTLDNNYLAGNNGAGAGVADVSTAVTSSGSTPAQYEGVASVTNPRNTPN